MFGSVTAAVREELITQVGQIEQSYATKFREHPDVPGVAKVILKQDALAKSHRPSRLLSEETCPIIGVGTFRELYVRVTPVGLQSLRQRLSRDTSQEATANISTVAELLPLDARDLLGVSNDSEISSIKDQLDRARRMKVQLFDHHDSDLNSRVFLDFQRYVSTLGCEITQSLPYTANLTIHDVTMTGQDLDDLLGHPGVRRAGLMPRFYALRHASIPVSDAATTTLPTPIPGDEYPVVGVIDSGIADSCGPLQPWIIGREVLVAEEEQNREHGTFVAGLVVLAQDINVPGVADSGGPCHVLDVLVIPNDDPRNGVVDVLTEDQLVAALRDVIPKYKDRVKVWNLSLGSDNVCSDAGFSDFGQVLDSIQDEHGVQFVLAAGNLETLPLRVWPAQPDMGERDRICSPADSVASLTIGALAHARNVQSLVDVDEPSPFSRRGPGPAYLVKPEVVHYGGNCDDRLQYQGTGVRSLDVLARVVEDVGTSFATPIVSGLLANILNALDPEPSLNLAKALLIHAARYPHDDVQEPLNYYGFGKPASLERIVQASQSAATLVFEDELTPGSRMVLNEFPFPDCLIKEGRSTGHIRMTLVYDPPLDGNYGLEYCRANVSASLGTWGPAVNKETGELQYVRQVPPDPSLSGSAYEEDLVRFGFKWCPVKSYKRDFKRGVNARDWRLAVELLHRHDQPPSPQSFALVVTITGQDGDPVYDDMVAALRVRAYSTQDLRLKSAVQQRIRARLS